MIGMILSLMILIFTTNKIGYQVIDLDASDVENDNLTYTIVQTPSKW